MEYLGQVSDYYLLKNKSASWNLITIYCKGYVASNEK
jgi:hypothetical protein